MLPDGGLSAPEGMRCRRGSTNCWRWGIRCWRASAASRSWGVRWQSCTAAPMRPCTPARPPALPPWWRPSWPEPAWCACTACAQPWRPRALPTLCWLRISTIDDRIRCVQERSSDDRWPLHPDRTNDVNPALHKACHVPASMARSTFHMHTVSNAWRVVSGRIVDQTIA